MTSVWETGSPNGGASESKSPSGVVSVTAGGACGAVGAGACGGGGCEIKVTVGGWFCGGGGAVTFSAFAAVFALVFFAFFLTGTCFFFSNFVPWVP